MLVVLAGAGFSKGFGLPLTDELKEFALKRCSDPDPAASVDFLNTSEYPLSEFANPDGRIPDIEYLLTIWLDYLNQLEQAGVSTAPARHSYHAFLENICCHLYAKTSAAVDAAGERVQAMATWLNHAREHYDVRFITFNYDLLLEAICRRAGGDFVYLRRPSETVAVPIRKLHGSLNWRIFFRELPQHSAEIVQLYHDNEQYIYAMCDPNHFWPGEAGRAPFIIPPSASKEYEALLWQSWRFAIGDIEVAEKVLIVGYSFPPLDAFATIQLRRALHPSSQAGKRPKAIHYVCPSANDCGRVSELLGLTDQAVFSEPWEIKHFDALLEAPTPAGQAE